MSDNEEEQEQDKIECTCNYGGITQESKFWDDLEDLGENELLHNKIVKVKVYTGLYNSKQAIFGLGFTYKNIINGKTQEIDHKGSKDYEDIKEFELGPGEYLTDFHIRFPNEAEYISQIGFSSTKNHFLVPEKTEDGEDKTIVQNGGNNILVGTLGCFNEKLDATGCYFISKKNFFKLSLLGFLLVKHKIKKDKKFKEEWDNKYKNLAIEYQYIWRAVNLPDTSFSCILKYCFM